MLGKILPLLNLFYAVTPSSDVSIEYRLHTE